MGPIARIGALLVVVALVLPATAGAADGRASSIRGEIRAYYQQGLGREPDRGGWNSYARAVSAGCLDRLGPLAAKPIFASVEFLTVRKTWEARVDALYRGMLDREPDAGGRERWLAALYRREIGWSEVVDGFSRSLEYDRRRRAICERPDWPVRYTHNLGFRWSHWNEDTPWGPCYDVEGGSVCRGLRGVEGFVDPSTGKRYDFLPQDWTVEHSDAKRFRPGGLYGGTLVSSRGNVYEGCQRVDGRRYRCDYGSRRPDWDVYQRDDRYWLKILRDWAHFQYQRTLPCVYDIVGIWVGATEPHDVVIDCAGRPFRD